MTWRWRSPSGTTGGATAAVLEGMLRALLGLCRRAGPALHRDRVLAIVEEEYRGDP